LRLAVLRLPAGMKPPIWQLFPAPTAGTTCYNTSHCPYPQTCVLESPYRRYCADAAVIAAAGRSLFAPQPVGEHGCERCASPLVLTDFGDVGADDLGAYACDSRCVMPDNATAPAAVVESYQTRSCRTACELEPAELLGAASIAPSALFPGIDDGRAQLAQLRAAAREAADAAAAAAEAAEAARLRAVPRRRSPP
jgi:hypothetical protein